MFCSGCGKQLPDGSGFCSGCGKRLILAKSITSAKAFPTPDKDGCVYDLQGVRGRYIKIYENKCIITTKPSFGSFFMGNMTDGEKTIYYRDCIGIQFKKARYTIGYLQIETSSGMMNNNNSNFAGENSFTFDINVISNEKMEEVANYVKSRIETIKNQGEKPATIVAQLSPAEELKKFKELLDLGAITQEEFDAKKKQLLGL